MIDLVAGLVAIVRNMQKTRKYVTADILLILVILSVSKLITRTTPTV